MRHARCLGSLSVFILGMLVQEFAAAAAPAGVGPLVWFDEFNGSAVDNSKWHINEPGMWGDGDNTAEAVSVGSGMLKITTYTAAPNDHKIAVLGTQDTQLFTFGYFEARIQFNSSPGMWSAFWLLSPTINTAPNDPAGVGTEIDVVEHRARNAAGDDRLAHYYTNIHWGGYGANHQQLPELLGPMAGLGNGTWHTYGLLWTSTGYQFYFDDQLVRTITTAVSQRSEYLLLSSLVADNDWAGNIPAGGYGSAATSTTNMLVDYVRVYSIPEPQVAGLLLACVLCAGRRGRRRSA